MAKRKRPFVETRNGRLRVRWPGPDGKLRGSSTDDAGQPFADEAAALTYGYEQMGQIRRGEWADPRKGNQTLTEWVNTWFPSLDIEDTTRAGYQWELEYLILPTWGNWTLHQIGDAAIEIEMWEQRLRTDLGYARSSAASARSLLAMALDDAIRVLGLKMVNPARKDRRRGRKVDNTVETQEEEWATPLEALLVAERCAVLAGNRDDDFILHITMAYTATRWGEALGLERGHVKLSKVEIAQQLYEHRGRFLRKAPKSGSYRDGKPGRCPPVDLPLFLANLLSEQAKRMAGVKCTCTGEPPYCDGRQYLFLAPDGSHHRRSNYARRRFRPAADGWYPAEKNREARPVLVDASDWPGRVLRPWPAAVAGEEFDPSSGRGWAPIGEEVPLAQWAQVHRNLTPKGLRHGHKVWMIEDNVPEVAQANRLGHRVPGIRGVYGHVSPEMRRALLAALQLRWERSLADRYTLDPRSSVPVLDELLKPLREQPRELCSQSAPISAVGALR